MADKIISEKRMSFLPEDYVERRIERRTSLVCLCAFVIALGAVGGAHAYKMHELSGVQAQLNKVNIATADAAKRIEQVEALEARKQEMLRKAQVTALLLERVPRTFLMADLINRMPDSLSLLEMGLTTALVTPVLPSSSRSALSNSKKKEAEKAKEPEPLPQQSVSLLMIGVAPTDVQVAQYIQKLTQSPLLSDVSLIYSEETKFGEVPMRKFRIEMALSPAADVRTIEPAKRQQDRPRDPIESKKNGLPQLPKVDLQRAAS